MINDLVFTELRIPFKIHFEHSAAKRNETQSVLVTATGDSKNGYGEGCPREYVTNESIASSFSFFTKVKEDILNSIDDINTLKVFKVKNHEIIIKNHAIWCAIETAIIDLFAKQHKCSIEHYLSLPELRNQFQYSAVIGTGSMSYFEEVAKKHLEIGFKDFKIKITGNSKLDFVKLLYLKKLCKSCTIRLDANNIWTNSDDAVNYIKQLPIEVTGIEEPLASKEIKDLIELSSKISTPIILDESFCRIEQLDSIKDRDRPFVINLRISKMGGILNSLEIVRACSKHKIQVIIGAQVGETSILTRAALTVANIAGSSLLHQEGAYGTLLLQHDIIEPALMFGAKGILNPQSFLNIKNYGFQLKSFDINRKHTVSKQGSV